MPPPQFGATASPCDYSTMFPPEIRGLSRRAAVVPNLGSVEVCRYVVRIDSDGRGGVGTHGWQVRYPTRSTSRYFSDSTGKLRGSPRQSLDRALQYLAAVYSGPTVNAGASERANKSTLLGVPGVRIVTRIPPGRTGEQLYFEVVKPQGGFKRIYVGIVGKISDERFVEKLKAAEELRHTQREMLLIERQQAYAEQVTLARQADTAQQLA